MGVGLEPAVYPAWDSLAVRPDARGASASLGPKRGSGRCLHTSTRNKALNPICQIADNDGAPKDVPLFDRVTAIGESVARIVARAASPFTVPSIYVIGMVMRMTVREDPHDRRGAERALRCHSLCNL
jgi:hypothetical protein